MPDPASGPGYPSVEGLHVPVEGQGTIACRFIRGLANPQPGGPDLVIDGDTLVSLHVDRTRLSQTRSQIRSAPATPWSGLTG